MDNEKIVCPVCGQEIEKGTTICPFCGVELDEDGEVV